jgi:colicin import membrane protein
MTEETALIIAPGFALADVFNSPDVIEKVVGAIREEALKTPVDLTTDKGRKLIASAAYSVAQKKTAIDARGKSLTEESRKLIDAVNASRNAFKTRLQEVQDEVRKPLTDWEAAEDARIAAIKERIAKTFNGARLAFDDTPEAGSRTAANLKEIIAEAEAVAIDQSWQEYLPAAAVAKDDFLRDARRLLASREQAEAQEAELARLRAAEQERIAKEAAEKAEADRLAEIKRRDDELKEAEARAAAKAKADAEQAEAARVAKEAADREAERKAAADREAALQKQIADQKAETERAAQAERDRIAAQAKAEEDAKAKREADQAHRAAIRKAIAAAVSAIKDQSPEAIADALIEGKIPHVEVKF